MLKGIIAAMITPFNINGEINYEATQLLVNRLIEKGISGLFILGTNGEFQMLDEEEKFEFSKYVVKCVDGRVPVMAGIGGNNTQSVIKLAKKMENIGVDYYSVITPYFVKLTEEELLLHYETIARSTNIPIILYNIPKLTGNSLSPTLVTKLSKIKTIVGVKDSSGSLENIRDYIEQTRGNDFFVVCGSDSLILESLKLGASGAVAATANVITDIDISIYNSFINGDLFKAQENQNKIEEFRKILKIKTLPSVLKYSVELLGIPVGAPRLPVSHVNNEEANEIIKVLKEYYNLISD